MIDIGALIIHIVFLGTLFVLICGIVYLYSLSVIAGLIFSLLIGWIIMALLEIYSLLLL